MSLREVDDFGENKIESDSPPPIGLPGKRPVRQPKRDVPGTDVVKMFFDTCVVVRDRTTPNTAQARWLLEGFSSRSLFELFSSVFARVQSNGARVAVNKTMFAHALTLCDCLPIGAQALDRQHVGVVNENGDVLAKRQRRVLTGVRFVSTEEELGACASTFLEMPKDF